MAKPQWRDRLREELRNRNLPPAYAARLIEELTDHVTDLEQENPSMDAQMLVAMSNPIRMIEYSTGGLG